MLPTDRYPTNENRAIMIDPNGSVSWDYPKATEVFTDGNQPGPGLVPTVDTPYGRLATVIRLDADLPQLVRQAGKAGTDILLVPSSDWKEFAEAHSRMAVFRAVENGVALVRPTRRGTSIASDHQGRLLGYKSDYFVGTDHTMIVNVPTSGAGTLYARTGASAGYASSACRCSWASRGCAGGNREFVMSPIRSSPLPATGSRRAVRQVWVPGGSLAGVVSRAAACRTGLPQRCSPGHQPPMRPMCAPRHHDHDQDAHSTENRASNARSRPQTQPSQRDDQRLSRLSD